MPLKDREAHRKYCSEYGRAHRDEINKRHNAWRAANKDHRNAYMRERRRATVVFLREMKAAAGCARCGECDPIVLDFHHANGQKERSIANMTALGRERVLSEIENCIVLCANCHRREHLT